MIAYIRETGLLTDALIRAYVAAQQIQIDRDFGPIWNVKDECVFVPPGSVIPDGARQVIFKDRSDQTDATGYHTGTGTPVAFVFAQDCIDDGIAWAVTASHETLEMLADPLCSRTQRVTIDGVTWDYAWEVCDAPEDDAFAYAINGIHMTDFVLPNWFIPDAPGPYSFRDALRAPLALAEGGYIGRREVAPSPGTWAQVFADKPGPRQRKGPLSRTMRRFAAAATAPKVPAVFRTLILKEFPLRFHQQLV